MISDMKLEALERYSQAIQISISISRYGKKSLDIFIQNSSNMIREKKNYLTEKSKSPALLIT